MQSKKLTVRAVPVGVCGERASRLEYQIHCGRVLIDRCDSAAEAETRRSELQALADKYNAQLGGAV